MTAISHLTASRLHTFKWSPNFTRCQSWIWISTPVFNYCISGMGSSRTGLDFEDKILWLWPRRCTTLTLAARRSGH